MFTWVKGRLFVFISSFIYSFMLLGLFFFDDKHRYEKALFLLVLSLFSLLWAFILYRRIRLIEDTAATTLSSAAQGYVELEGKASLYEGEVVRGPDPELPSMLWYRNHMFSSWAGFILSDEKGRCTIDPRGAEVITPWYSYNQHYYHAIYPNETIYVLGQLHTLKKQRNEYEVNNLALSKLAQWKQNITTFHDYFDIDNDGHIDNNEIALAKNAADRIVDLELEETYRKPATHVVSQPEDGRPFIVSSIHPNDLIRRYKRASLFHLGAWIILTIFILAMQVS